MRYVLYVYTYIRTYTCLYVCMYVTRVMSHSTERRRNERDGDDVSALSQKPYGRRPRSTNPSRTSPTRFPCTARPLRLTALGIRVICTPLAYTGWLITRHSSHCNNFLMIIIISLPTIQLQKTNRIRF